MAHIYTMVWKYNEDTWAEKIKKVGGDEVELLCLKTFCSRSRKGLGHASEFQSWVHFAVDFSCDSYLRYSKKHC